MRWSREDEGFHSDSGFRKMVTEGGGGGHTHGRIS